MVCSKGSCLDEPYPDTASYHFVSNYLYEIIQLLPIITPPQKLSATNIFILKLLLVASILASVIIFLNFKSFCLVRFVKSLFALRHNTMCK